MGSEIISRYYQVSFSKLIPKATIGWRLTMTDSVAVDRCGGSLEITLDRPKANAIDAATSHKLADAFLEFREDSELRVAIVTGAGEHFFSAGWDLKRLV